METASGRVLSRGALIWVNFFGFPDYTHLLCGRRIRDARTHFYLYKHKSVEVSAGFEDE